MSKHFIFNQEQLSIINGSLLGDGHISGRLSKKVSYFTKTQAGRRRKYLEWHVDKFPLFSSVSDGWTILNGKNFSRSVFRTYSDTSLFELRQKWYPNGKKIVPLDLELDPLSIAIWFFDDGSNHVKKRQVKFATYCFTRAEVEFLADQFLMKFYVKCGISKKNEIVVRTESYKTFIDLVKPFHKI